MKHKEWVTFKEAPSTKDYKGQEEVCGEVVQGGRHHTSCACAVVHCEVEAGTAGGSWEGVVKVGESQGAGDGFRWQEGEQADEDETGDQGQGGGKHCGFHQSPAKL